MAKRKNSPEDAKKRSRAAKKNRSIEAGRAESPLTVDWKLACDALQGHLDWIDQLLKEKRGMREDMQILMDHMESNMLKDKKAIAMLQSILTRLES